MSTDICFQHSDWRLLPPHEDFACGWANAQGLIITLRHIGEDKPLRKQLADVAGLRSHYRTAFAAQGAGLIECDALVLEELPAVWAVAKTILEPTHAAYIGTIAVPVQRESFVFDVGSEEKGVSRIREAAVWIKASKTLESQGYELDRPPESTAGQAGSMAWRNAQTGEVLRWAQDPYEPDFEGPCLCNMADAPEHDAGFPNHPLSQVRAALRCLKETVKFSSQLKKRALGRSGWRFW